MTSPVQDPPLLEPDPAFLPSAQSAPTTASPPAPAAVAAPVEPAPASPPSQPAKAPQRRRRLKRRPVAGTPKAPHQLLDRAALTTVNNYHIRALAILNDPLAVRLHALTGAKRQAAAAILAHAI